MHFRTIAKLLTCLIVVTAAQAGSAQEVFNYDFDTVFPGDLASGGYGYGFAYAGQGAPDCSMNIDNNSETSATFDITSGPDATATADFSNWMLDPAGPCWTYAGWGLGLGHVMGFNDGTGNVGYSQQFTSNDLSQYTLEFDAWVEGVDLLGIDAYLRIDFQGPDLDPGSGSPVNALQIGFDNNVISNGLALPLLLTPTSQSFSIAFDTLPELGTADNDGDGVPDQGGTGPGSVAAWQAANWMGTTQIQVQIQPQGDEITINETGNGPDANNVLHIDNFKLTAPFMAIDNGVACDLDGDSDCDGDDIDALNAAVVADMDEAAFDITGDGVVDIADVAQWLVDAGAENAAITDGNPFLAADANLDGFVDISDRNLWNGAKFTASSEFTMGDFNSDGFIDVSDLNIWNNLKFMSSDSVSAVPEPSSALMLLITFVGMGLCRRR